MNPVNSQILLCGTTRVYRSMNRADGWTAIGSLDGQSISQVAFAPSAPDTTYYAATFGHIYRTNDGGGNWKDVTGNLPTLTATTSLVVDPTDLNTVYVSGFNGPRPVFRTQDGGVT